ALRDIAGIGGSATGRARGDEAVAGAVRAGAAARLGHVAVARRDAAGEGGREEEVDRAAVGEAVTDLGQVAAPGRGATGGARELFQVGWTDGEETGARLRRVARVGGGATSRAGGLELAGGRAAVAIIRIAVVALLADIERAVSADGERIGRREDEEQGQDQSRWCTSM